MLLRKLSPALIAGVLLLAPAWSQAQDDVGCIAARYKAAAKYALCQAKTKATIAGDDLIKGLVDASKCRMKYAKRWTKLQVKYPATLCAAARFVDNLDGTVTDNLTGLVWEQKTNLDSTPNPGDPHDADNMYGWTDGDADTTDEDGAAFTDFLENLNAGAGFAGANGWRLPTFEELQTILLPEYLPCTVPCIDPLFGPTPTLFDGYYWSATSSVLYPSAAWVVSFFDRDVSDHAKGSDNLVRAVRGGM